jgi:hypothetical protein
LVRTKNDTHNRDVNAPRDMNDSWLTPKDQIDLLGPFDLDPCCPTEGMPWRTARAMVLWSGAPGEVPQVEAHYGKENWQEAYDMRGDGLALDWSPYGRVWCNFPYSDPLPWVEKMAEHKNGILLAPGKSPDAKWGQLLLGSADLVFFPRGRFAFWRPDGTPSKGKWNPHVYAAYGWANVDAMLLLAERMPGVLMTKAQRTYEIRKRA